MELDKKAPLNFYKKQSNLVKKLVLLGVLVVIVLVILFALGVFSSSDVPEGESERVRVYRNLKPMTIYLDRIEFMDDYIATLTLEPICNKEDEVYFKDLEERLPDFNDKVRQVVSQMNYYQINTITKQEINLKPFLLETVNSIFHKKFMRDINMNLELTKRKIETSAIALTIGEISPSQKGKQVHIESFKIPFRDSKNLQLIMEVVILINSPKLSLKYNLEEAYKKFIKSLETGYDESSYLINSYKVISEEIRNIVINCDQSLKDKLGTDISRECFNAHTKKYGFDKIINQIRTNPKILQALDVFFNKAELIIQAVYIPLYYKNNLAKY